MESDLRTVKELYHMPKDKRNPGEDYPELIEHMAKLSNKIQELYELGKPETMAKPVNLRKQTMQHHINKLKKGRKHETK